MVANSPVVRILHLDDDKAMAWLLKSFLQGTDQELHVSIDLVSSKEAYLKALESHNFDLILSDFAMPGYDGYEALRDAKANCPDIPFIMVTGEMGEERAIETLKQGAIDYVLKDRLQRLVPSIKRALKDAALEQERRKGQQDLSAKTAELREAQRIAHVGSWYWHPATDALSGSEELFRIYGFNPATQAMPAFQDQKGRCYPPEEWERVNSAVRRSLETGVGYELDLRAIRDGAQIWITMRGEVVRDSSGGIVGLRGTVQEITERKEAEARIAALASFPALDPNPTVEVDARGTITYANRAASRILKDLESGQDLTLFLPADIADMLGSLSQGEGPESYYREVIIGSHVFGEYIYLSRELGVVRLYAVDITERRRAEEALRLSQEKYAASFANNPAVITLTRLEDGVYLEVNDTWVAMTGYSREEAIGHSARKMPIWPTQDDAARFVQEIREKGFVRGREQEFRKKSGEAFLVEMSSQILTIQGEKVILSTMVDITEQHHAEEALRASEALARNRLEELEAIYKTAPVGLCFLDKDLRWVRINDTLARMNGFPVAAHIGKTPWELIPDFGEQAEAAMRKVLETGEPLVNIEFTGTTPAQPGVVRSFEERWLPWRDQQGNIVGISVATEETTERKRMEAALLSSEENLRLMVNEASDAMVVLDPGGVIQAVSHLGAQLLGYEESELIGKNAEQLAETFSRLEVALKLEDLRTHAPRPVTTSVYVRTKAGAVQLFSVKVRSVGLGTKAEKYFIKFAGVDFPAA